MKLKICGPPVFFASLALLAWTTLTMGLILVTHQDWPRFFKYLALAWFRG